MRHFVTLIISLLFASTLFAQDFQEQYQELVDNGDELYYEYRYDEAALLFDEAYLIAKDHLSIDEVYYSTISRIVTYRNLDQHSRAGEIYLEVFPNYEDQFNSRQKGRLLYQYGLILNVLNEFEESVAVLDSANFYIESAQDTDLMGYSDLNSSGAFIYLGRYDEAETRLERVKELNSSNVDLLISLNLNLYSLYSYQSDENAGIEYLMDAYELTKDDASFNYPEQYLNVLVQLTYYHHLQNNYGESLAFANEGLQLAEELNRLSQAASLNDLLGRIYNQLQEYERSLFHFNEAIRIYESRGSISQANSLKISVTFLLSDLKELELAEDVIGQVMGSMLSPFQRLRALLAYADLVEMQGNYVQAKYYLDKALNELDENILSVDHLIYDQYMDLPIISNDERIEFAIKVYESAKRRSVYHEMTAELSLAKAFESTNSDSAFKYAYSALDKLEERRYSTTVNSLKSRLNVNWQSFYYQIADWEIEYKSDYDKAFELFEMSKSRALFDQIYEGQQTDLINSNDPASLRILELQKKLDREYRELESLSIVDDSESSLFQLSQLELEYQTELDALAQSNPELANLTYPKVSSLEQTQDLLDDNSAYLSYGIRNDQLYIILVKSNQVVFNSDLMKEDTRGLITGLVNDFRNSIIELNDVAKMKSISEQITEMIIEPVINDLSGIEHLIISPDGPLHLLPFEALSIGDDFLIEKFTVKYLPSISVYDVIEYPDIQSFESDLLAIAVSGFESGDGYFGSSSQSSFATLPYAVAEVDSINNYFTSSTVLKNEEVTEFTFKNLDFSDYRFLHLATHGNIDERIPDQSGLILSKKIGTETLFGEDGYLNARELSQLNIPAELVVLSACNTGTGKVIRGEGVMGLQRSILSAGASSVIVSLWNIFDRSTLIFMNKFYENMQEIEDDEVTFLDRIRQYADIYEPDLIDYKTLALQETKIEMINHPYYNHPVHWAPFVITGK
jgi:CHAT domain-containing protein